MKDIDQQNIRSKQDFDDDVVDEHEHDIVMPGFRFHPTEEELIDFYLLRKVEGKRFNVQLITFLDLYRYDPWELPALAAIGEKEWYFYVPRDKKYRNGDRPNRVTTSGYWKATGADRTIRSENNLRSIGLKKTLVFYTGKAPKGIRTSWIMNEYRLPHEDTERLQKSGEISLCRVYKRPGVEDHPFLPRSRKHNEIRRNNKQAMINERSLSFEAKYEVKLNSETSPSSSSTTTTTHDHELVPSTLISNSSIVQVVDEDDKMAMMSFQSSYHHQHHLSSSSYIHNNNNIVVPNLVSQFSTLQGSSTDGFADRLMWDWNVISERATKDYYSNN